MLYCYVFSLPNRKETAHMYLRSMTSQNSQTILKTLFKSRHLFFVFLLFANHAATAAEVPDLGIETVRVNRTTLHPGDTFRLETVIRNHGKAAATPCNPFLLPVSGRYHLQSRYGDTDRDLAPDSRRWNPRTVGTPHRPRYTRHLLLRGLCQHRRHRSRYNP